MNCKNKVAVVTGAAGGIGRCIAERFRDLGAKIAVIDRLNQPEDLTCEFYFQGDIAKEPVLVKFSEQVIEKFGCVDYLINNACLSRVGILSSCGWEDFLYVQKVGVAAPYMLSKLLLPYFNSGASIINIASTRAFMSQENTESYTAAKGGILALTHALAVSLAGRRIRVNCISPGWIDTSGAEFTGADSEQHPAGRVGKPEDIADAVLYLCGASFITGENLIIDGGMSRLMIYHGDNGWVFENDVPSKK